MTHEEARQLATTIMICAQKARSNIVEGLGGFGASLEQLSEAERSAVEFLNPGLFPAGEGKLGILQAAIAVVKKGSAIEPIDLFNLLYLANNDMAFRMQYLLLLGEELPSASPMPAWLQGWKRE